MLIVFAQLLDDGVGVGDRVGVCVERRDVDQMQQQPGAREMAQKLVAQPGAFGGALDQAGNVGDDEAAVDVHPHHAQIGCRVVKG